MTTEQIFTVIAVIIATSIITALITDYFNSIVLDNFEKLIKDHKCDYDYNKGIVASVLKDYKRKLDLMDKLELRVAFLEQEHNLIGKCLRDVNHYQTDIETYKSNQEALKDKIESIYANDDAQDCLLHDISNRVTAHTIAINKLINNKKAVSNGKSKRK
jgi:phosphopantetheine adenylyltransferase